ncbi:MAG: glycogen debranching enzyme family protein [Bacteroidales bacterium]|jgi:predicted glycogen debranching enzyme|nr:glycogen debranching enzyme family protein [Bacteroidales bacterium]MBQ2197271.1 glycogen debranching enzyme family protein [Bacteroidales bacterium]
MAFLKFNKSELVNLSYSLKREIINANKTGAYCNTSIVTCNTRRYHGLLAVPVDAFGGSMHLLLSSIDESLVLNGKQFNLGIHCYGDIYEPRGHKYIIDFEADPVPKITYKVGEIIFTKTILLVPDADQVMIRYELLNAPSKVRLLLTPFLAFRDIHLLTSENPTARTEGWEIPNGMAWCLYDGFPDLNIQFNTKEVGFKATPCWYKGVTYSDEYRRGFDCREDLYVPGHFEADMKPGEAIVLSAGVNQVAATQLKRKFETLVSKIPEITSFHDHLVHCADLLIRDRNGRKKITAGFSWMFTGLLRETLVSLPGLTLYANGDKASFEEILDNLIADNQERLFHRTTQVEAPLRMAGVLKKYIEYGADAKAVWKKYGATVKHILESYLPGRRSEVAMQPNGLLWAQLDHVALSWMNAYVNGNPVTERAGYQVETNSLWYHMIKFAIEMEKAYGPKGSEFVKEWTRIAGMVKDNFQPVFWNPGAGYLADYVDNEGQHMEVRPNMLFALVGDDMLVEPEVASSVLHVIDNELVTRRGLRTLSPRDARYKGVYEGTQVERDLAYHEGCTRVYLLAYYIDTCFRMKGPSFINRAQWLVNGFYEDLNKHGVGSFSELYDGDPPHEPHGAISSAVATAALLTVDYLISKYKEA